MKTLALMFILLLWTLVNVDAADVMFEPMTRPNLCDLPMKIGRCKAAKPRYYYDSTEGRCKRFLFGGCQGNANNFKSAVMCVLTCEYPMSITYPQN